MEQETVLITGAGSGIGRATARAFAPRVRGLVLTDLDEGAVAELASELGSSAIAMDIDVTDRDSVERVFRRAEEQLGPISVVHANAGVSSMKRAMDLTEADWEYNHAVNAKGVFFTNQVAVRHFLAHGLSGRIVNTASLAAKVGAPFLGHYAASKFAVVGWTQSLALEVAGQGIRVNAVCPGYVQTSMQDREVEWEARLRGLRPEQVRQEYIDQTPLGRLCTPEDVAEVVLFLASEASGFMTGQALNVTGGIYKT
jgi:NAD(P)-dependent dehydrogenase (short-subunit alcohol dehydrogenase family)